MERGREEFARTQVSYNVILLRAIEDCRQARVSGDLMRYSEAVMALYDTLAPSIKKSINPTYEKIQKDIEDKVEQTKGELPKLVNIFGEPAGPAEQWGYYQTRMATIERENTDKLYNEIIKVLEDRKILQVVSWVPSGMGA